MNRHLNATIIVEKVEQLERRVFERFPQRNLGRVCTELHTIARDTEQRVEWIAKPNRLLRGFIGFCVSLFIFIIIRTLLSFNLPDQISDLAEFLQILEAGVNDLVFIAVAIFFLISIEVRIKRRRSLAALHELRSMAHLIDMHQLTKDPQRVLRQGADTASSPKERMTPFELFRYLDYCSEMLSLIGKIAALYVQDFDDEVVLAVVTEIEELTGNMSSKIWQKIMIIQTVYKFDTDQSR